MRGRTSFVIAHRLSTIRRADNVLVINNGEIIERGTHEELLEMKGFYYRVYMSQFKGTNGSDIEPIRLAPAETPVPQISPPGMSGGGHGGMPGIGQRSPPNMRHGMMMEIVAIFKKHGATSPENAMTLEALDLPPIFGMMLRGPMGQMGIFVEYNGKYYLSEERINQLRTNFSRD
jgi:ABC-type glutathione transport system ATPase component